MEKLLELIDSLIKSTTIEDENEKTELVGDFFQDMIDCMLDQIVAMPYYSDLIPQIDKKMKDESTSEEEKVAFIDEVIGSVDPADGAVIFGRAVRIIILRTLLSLIDSHRLTNEGLQSFLNRYRSNDLYYQRQSTD
jgi:aspartate-semialdehyde dehydrogenase